MKLLFTKSKLPLSIVIRCITGEPCSHFSFVFESQSQGLLFQSNLLGTGVEFFSKAKKSWGYTIVHEIDLPMPVEEEDRAWDIIVNQYSDTNYNFLGAIYLGWRCILKRIFKTMLPIENKWNQNNSVFCDQIYTILNLLNDPRLPKINVMSGMDTPETVWKKINLQT